MSDTSNMPFVHRTWSKWVVEFWNFSGDKRNSNIPLRSWVRVVIIWLKKHVLSVVKSIMFIDYFRERIRKIYCFLIHLIEENYVHQLSSRHTVTVWSFPIDLISTFRKFYELLCMKYLDKPTLKIESYRYVKYHATRLLTW